MFVLLLMTVQFLYKVVLLINIPFLISVTFTLNRNIFIIYMYAWIYENGAKRFDFTLISLPFRPPPSHVKGKKSRKDDNESEINGQRKTKRTDSPLNFCIVAQPANLILYSTLFINPDMNTFQFISLYIVNRRRWLGRPVNIKLKQTNRLRSLTLYIFCFMFIEYP